jgi:hypothetical protein
MMDGKALGQQILDAVKGYVSRTREELLGRLDQLEDRIKAIPAGERGPPGERGKDGDPGKPGEQGPSGESIKGDPGKDGTSVTPEDVLPALTAELHKAISAIPIPLDGKDGRDGVDGKSVTVDELLPTIKQWFDALPRPKDGKDGVDGKSITIDDVSGLMESSLAKWALDFERRGMDLIQRCIDRIEKPKNGEKGKDGIDGVGFDDLEVVHDGARTFTLKFTHGERVKEFRFKVPVLLEQGIYSAGRSYEKGDGVTFGGSYWIAQTDTTLKPGENSDWRLAVKKGRDGKDGLKGDPGKNLGSSQAARQW